MARRGSKAGAGKRTGGSLHGNGGGTAVSDREAASPPPPPGRADPGKQMVQTKSPNERPQPQVVPPVELAVPTSVEVPSQRVSDTPGPPPEEPGTLSPTAAAASPHVESVSESVGNSFVAERTPASTEGATGATPAVIEPTITSPSPAREAAVQPATPSSPPQPVPPPVKREPASESHQPPLLFEVAWEVCWQLGGIYTVLKSKAACMLDRWGDRYCMIGPYNPNTAAVEFEETPPDWHLRDVLQKLRESGITAYFGRWLIAGRPRVILLDYRGRYPSLDVDKYLLYQDHGIGTHAGDGEVNEVIAFGFCVQEFFRHFTNLHPGRPVCAHFHEWMGGVAVPRIAHLKIPVATVFTTHATLLGRYLAGDNPDFYNHLPFLNPEAEAQRYGIYPRYQIEKAAAHASTVFTTVSEVTNYEAEKLLGRTPDAILPNGLNIQRFAAPHEFQHLHRQYKEAIHEFVMGHFFPSQPFDLDRTLYFFTAGRYEYRNKGLDLFIEAMHRLNERLRGEPDRPTVVAFVVTKAPVRNINVGVLQSQSMFEDMKKWCGEMEGRIGRRMFLTAANGRLPKYEDLIDEDSMVRLKQSIFAWRTGRQPPIVTHDLVDDANDPVLKHLRYRHLFNGSDDAVKVVFHPQFVTATSPLIGLDYENFVRGCHMGIFPSYYEPWGYTPMECVALGLPAVTTDLSGFGAYVQRHIPGADQQGICVLNRRTKHFDETTNNLVDYLYEFCRLQRRNRIELRNKVERLGELFDWSALVRHYHDAHDMSLLRVGAKVGRLEVRVV